MPLSLIVDILVAMLLVIAIGYAVALNKRLRTPPRDKEQLERLVEGFAKTTERAEAGIGALHSMTDILQQRLGCAESLRDDLVFLTERGNQAADRLEDVVRDARGQEAGAPAAEPQKKAAVPSVNVRKAASDHDFQRKPSSVDPIDRPATDEVSEAERELLRALRSAG